MSLDKNRKLRKQQDHQKAISEAFREEFDRAMENKFGVKFETTFNIFQMSLVTKRLGGRMTKEMKQYGEGFSDGYAKAMSLVPTKGGIK